MKNFILLLITTISIAQSQTKEHYIAFSSAIDVVNLSGGSGGINNKNTLDLLLQASAISENLEINIGYEMFNQMQFDKYTIGIGYHFPLYGYLFGKQVKTILITAIEPTLIDRYGTWGGKLSYNASSSHLTIGANLSFRIHLSDTFAIEYLFNALPRTDLAAKYPKETWDQKATISGIPISGNNFIKLIYKINRR